MYPLFETIAIVNFDAPYIAFHQQRMNESFLHLFHQPNCVQLDEVLKQTSISSAQLYKWRIEYGVDGYRSTIELYQPRVIQKISFHEISADFDYSLKYNNRLLFEEIKQQYPLCDEVILLKNGFLTDSLYANLVVEFKNDAGLYTPSTPLLKGTHRKRLLEEGLLKEKSIKIDEISDVKSILFINAMVNFENAPCVKLDFSS